MLTAISAISTIWCTMLQTARPHFTSDLRAVSAGTHKVNYYNLTMPNTHGVWASTFGRPPFAGPRRIASLGFLEYMQAGALVICLASCDCAYSLFIAATRKLGRSLKIVRSKASTERQWRRESCAGGMPLWPDPESAADPDRKRLSRRETFVAAPKWLFDIYPGRGREGFWGGSRPSVVAGHLIDMGGDNRAPKRFALKMLKWCAP